MKHALAVINRYNLATYYLLPLIGLNMSSFGCDRNFINCIPNLEGTMLFVSVHTEMFGPVHHPGLLEIKTDEVGTLFIFRFPEEHQIHFRQFKEGRYSQFSVVARQRINSGSGLPYERSCSDGARKTDLRLIALDRESKGWEIMRRRMSEYLDVYIPKSAELLSVPDPSSFWCFPALT